MELQINQRFKDAIPAPDAEEYRNLRESLQREGCRDAIITWNGVIVDGHNRYAICKELGIPFQTTEKSFTSEDDALEWIMRNQLSRRNLIDVERARIALKIKDLISVRAKEKKISTLMQNTVEANLPERAVLNTRKELSKISGVGERTLSKIERVDNEAPAPIRNAMGRTISINKASQLNDALKQVPEDEREAESQRLLDEEYRAEFDRIKREEKIAKIVLNMISKVALDYEYITDDCLSIYLKRTPASFPSILKTIDYEINLLVKIKNMLQQLKRAQGSNDDV